MVIALSLSGIHKTCKSVSNNAHAGAEPNADVVGQHLVASMLSDMYNKELKPVRVFMHATGSYRSLI